MEWKWCDDCQRKLVECDADTSTFCAGRQRREYMKKMAEYEASGDWLSEPPY